MLHIAALNPLVLLQRMYMDASGRALASSCTTQHIETRTVMSFLKMHILAPDFRSTAYRTEKYGCTAVLNLQPDCTILRNFPTVSM